MKRNLQNPNTHQSDAVITTPAQSGRNPRLRILIAMALPITSWISAPIKANSAMNHNNRPAHVGYSSLQSSARCRPVATPTLADNNWIKSPITVAHINSHSSEYPAMAPAWRSPSRFPGSRNAMLIRNPGPVNSHSFFHEKGGVAEASRDSGVSPSKSTIDIFSLDSYATSSSSDDGDSDEGDFEGKRRFASSSLPSPLGGSCCDGSGVIMAAAEFVTFGVPPPVTGQLYKMKVWYRALPRDLH